MDDYLLDIAKRSLGDYNRRHLVAGTANGSGVMVGHFNNFALHSIAMSLSLADNALLRHVLPPGNDRRIVTVCMPSFPVSFDDKSPVISGVAENLFWGSIKSLLGLILGIYVPVYFPSPCYSQV